MDEKKAVVQAVVNENMALKRQLEAEKIEREAQSRRIAAIEAALLHHG
jgi:hypothetical protein